MLRAVLRHLRRYPKWYAVAAAWAIAMALLPVVHNATAAPRRTTPAALDTPATVDQLLPNFVASLDPVEGSSDLTGRVASPAAEPPSLAPRNAPGTPSAPAPSGGLHIPPPPSVPIPTVPAQFDPALAALAPAASDACGALGLGRVALSLAPGFVNVPLPFNDALAYLVPLYGACALIPLPTATTTCPVDALVASKEPKLLVGAYVPPPVLGLVLDQFAALLTLGGLGPAASPAVAALQCTTT